MPREGVLKTSLQLPQTTSKSNNEPSSISRNHSLISSSLISGVGSGTLSSIVCAPLDLVRTRMQVAGDLRQSSKMSADLSQLSIRSTLRDIISTDGVQGCFRGLGPTLATVPAFWGIYFPVYEHMKVELTYFCGNDIKEGSSSQSLIHMTSAVVSGGFADLFCNPMFVVRTRYVFNFILPCPFFDYLSTGQAWWCLFLILFIPIFEYGTLTLIDRMQTEALHSIMSNNSRIQTRQNGIIQTIRGLYIEGENLWMN